MSRQRQTHIQKEKQSGREMTDGQTEKEKERHV